MTIKNQEALDERVNNLGTFNGINLALVRLQPTAAPTEAVLTVYFFNNNEVQNIFNDITAAPSQAPDIFPICGGHRLPAGSATGQVQVVAVADEPTDDKILHLTVTPIGDYSTYTLSVVYPNMDPLLSEIDFKFRPGCFNNCPPDWPASPKPHPVPAIDYLAKDYDSFRHTLIAWMMARVPGWQPTSEADLDQVLLELFSVAADELSDYQDRVMNEAYLSTARKRVSLARHARLMDYHIHQGNQATTWLALHVSGSFTLPAGFLAWTGLDISYPDTAVFMTRQPQTLDLLLNDISLYTWSDAVPALAAGSTSADLKFADQVQAQDVQDLIRDGTITHLLIQEHRNPLTGGEGGRDPGKRQLLQLLPGAAGATVMQDPVPTPTEWFVRVRWRLQDELKSNYCFTVNCPNNQKVEDVSLFHGNLVRISHGRPHQTVFKAPDQPLAADEQCYELRQRHGRQEAICHLPHSPLAYLDTLPGGLIPPQSTLTIRVDGETWDERISLVKSDVSGEDSDHFVVETDEEQHSLIRFGNGVNGQELPNGAVVECDYQVGRGIDGNVGADAIQGYDAAAHPQISKIWNPFDVTNGRSPEPTAEIIRRVPEAYRYHQLRAITLKDYVNRAESLPEVDKAAARYMWTGSWRTVRVAIDPVGTDELSPALRKKVTRHLDAVRLLGEELEVHSPRFVPLIIIVSLCIQPDYWPEDIKFILEQLFSDGYTPDGRLAFFHPDRWTFGQTLYASQILGEVQAVTGVDHVIKVSLKRWNEVTPGKADRIEVQPHEIIQVKNNPDHMEQGLITFLPQGGRQ